MMTISENATDTKTTRETTAGVGMGGVTADKEIGLRDAGTRKGGRGTGLTKKMQISLRTLLTP
jgi:hypothetical protein